MITILFRFDENFSREHTKIKFMTEGILIRDQTNGLKNNIIDFISGLRFFLLQSVLLDD